MGISELTDDELLQEISNRFEEKKSSILEMEFMTKKLLELNETTKQAHEVKSKFLSLIKNEFNNPMSSLLNLVEIIGKKSDNAKVLELSEMMKMELRKLDFSLKNIFAASEIEAGEIANDYSIIDTKELFDEIKNYFDYLIKEKSLQLEYTNHCDEKILSDTQKLDLILLNLISNACEYSYNGAIVSVTIDCNEVDYIISVEDSGEGIGDHIKDIYSRFSHFESGQTRRTAGLGLGLSVARGMIEALEGSIDNISKDQKTIFRVQIPKINEEQIEFSQGIGSNQFLFDDADGMMEF